MTATAVSGVASVSTGTGGGGGTLNEDRVPVIVLIGESNSGGIGANSDATAGELAVRPAVQIWDNQNNSGFLSLDIGTNNLIGHSELEAYVSNSHGMELGLANSVEAGDWATDTVYLLKAGQGGSTLAEWNRVQSFWTTFETRANALKAYLKTQGKVPLFYVWVSIGINDAVAATASATFKTQLEDWVDDIRGVLGCAAPVLYTELPVTYATYSGYLDEAMATRLFTYRIDTSDAALVVADPAHWSYAGHKTIAAKMVYECVNTIGEYNQYVQTQIYANAGGTVVAGGGGGAGDPIAANVVFVSNYAIDTSDAKGNALTVGGNAAVSGGKLVLDGNGDDLKTAQNSLWNFSAAGDFSVDCIANLASASGNKVLFAITADDSNYGIMVWASSGTLQAYVSTDGASWNIVSAGVIGAPSVGVDFYFCAERVANNINFYINNTRMLQVAMAAGLHGNATSRFNIGSWPAAAATQYWQGSIECIAVAKGASRFASAASISARTTPFAES